MEQYLPQVDGAIRRLARDVPRCRGAAFGAALHDLIGLANLRCELRLRGAVRRGEERRGYEAPR